MLRVARDVFGGDIARVERMTMDEFAEWVALWRLESEDREHALNHGR